MRAPLTPRGLVPLLVALLAALPGAGCGGSGGGGGGGSGGGGGGGGGCIAGGGALMVVTGTVTFERLPISPAGLGPGLVTLPARFVDVELTEAFGTQCYGTASTDATGAYSIAANPPAGSTLRVVAYSRTDYDALRNVTVHNALPPGGNAHTIANCFSSPSAVFPAGAGAVADVLVPYSPGNFTNRPSIGFGALDVLVTCAERIRASTGETPPLCHAYTQLGNAGATGTSFYNDFAKALTLLGGTAGNLDITDTDYFDDGVIAHEYGHFVEFNMAASRNRGGPHSGEAQEPALAWSEGAATGWGSLLRQDATYIDTIGTSPQAPLLNRNVENWTPQTVRGIGGEETVSEILWDLVDGTVGVPDADGDVVATAFGSLYAQFLAYDPNQVVPYIGTILDRAVNPVGVPAASITALMLLPENQQITYPLTGPDVWPVPLTVPGSATGACDSLPGPNKNQCLGLSSSVWHAFSLGAPATLTFTLTIGPTGGNGDNLNLFLETFAGGQLGSSTNGGAAAETIGPINLGAGNYVVRVEADCAGAGNQATFTLQVN